ncbi:MFS transporter [Streptomyces sp. SID8366]|uniref:MFS transporter n=1 Tax=unclassified Streptomyces TaxID=2593676 RepID=UPI000DBA14CC|nr:MFS transporter [Streptomyces sp. PsTaAH-130]MYU07283.1 MFS transporter [Streptomyces sp. SID8366]MYU67541.1 MFS transporter [Streptomyces sp. SID69]RAJ61534.1 putative MFS family arabinose efflux permease [Streptomyces sp. PsTaAH-130]
MSRPPLAEETTGAADTGPPPSLWRNRDFNLLWTGQSLSDLGGAMVDLALPLLVLQQTGSPTRAGVVGTAGLVTTLVCRLPAGVLADRFDRRRLMIVCDALRIAVYALLGWAVLSGAAGLPVILAVVIAGAAATAVFSTAEHASVRSLVRPDQLASAVARNEARTYGVSLAGPPLGGLLFGLGRFLPFLGNALSFLVSLAAVCWIRRPLQQPRKEVAAPVGASTAEGLRFLLGHPFLRALLVIAAPLNMAFTGMIFAMTLALRRAGVAPVLVGFAGAIFALGGFLGAFAAPALQRRMRLPVLITLLCWVTAALMAVSTLLSGSVLAAVPLAAAVFLGPTANAALFGHQAAVTPDHLQGRVVSGVLLAAGSAAALAPVLAGALLARWSAGPAMLVFPALVVVAAVTATVSKGIRTISPR